MRVTLVRMLLPDYMMIMKAVRGSTGKLGCTLSATSLGILKVYRRLWPLVERKIIF
jgi:hypothetical protein